MDRSAIVTYPKNSKILNLKENGFCKETRDPHKDSDKEHTMHPYPSRHARSEQKSDADPLGYEERKKLHYEQQKKLHVRIESPKL